MENFAEILKLYAFIFSLLATGYYFIPVSAWYYIFFIRKREKWNYMRVQDGFPGRKQILREIKYSALSIAIFSIIALLLVLEIRKGYTLVYFKISDYGIVYFLVSPLIAFVIHDTLFYWTHRFMHLKKVFRFIHLVHHKSTNPTPFSIYAFQPGEALIQSSIYPVILHMLPMHPAMLGFFMAYNMFINLAGHGGFEFMAPGFRRHWLFRWQNSVTNHDLHHTKFKCNFGFYFTFWDRIMHTLEEKENRDGKDARSVCG